MLKADIRVDYKKLDNLAKSTQGIASQAASELSAEVVRLAKENSRVDTGAMQAGWNRSKIGRGWKGGYRIYNTVPYTVFNEFGTSKMSAQPMLGPALTEVEPEIPKRVRKWVEIAINQFVAENSGGGSSEGGE